MQAYSIQNKGDAVRINVRGTDSGDWRLASIPGVDAFALRWNSVPDKASADWKSIYSIDTDMFTALAANQTLPFYLRYQSPRYITKGAGAAQNTTLKITAVSPFIGTWAITTFAEKGFAPYMAIESDTKFHLAYHNGSDNLLRYAAWAGTGPLVFENVEDIKMYIGDKNIKIALDSAKVPHIFYSGFGVITRLNYLRYASKNADGTWTMSEVDTGGTTEGLKAQSLVIGPDNTAYVSYQKNVSPDELVIRYKYKLSGQDTWIDGGDVGHGNMSAIALDAEGKPHIAYIGRDSAVGLNYVSRDAVSGALTTVRISASDTIKEGELRLAIDAAGRPYIVYVDESANTIEVASVDKTGAWKTTIASPNGGGEYVDMALDPSGYPSLVHTGDGVLKYIQWTGAEWLPAFEVDSSASTSAPSLKFDPEGRPHIFYVNGSTDYLQYAKWQ